MTAADTRDPGLAGVVPFRFECRRSGRCCTHGDGHVWLEPGEDALLAAARAMTPAAFRARHVRTVTDPRSGELREALTESTDAPAGNGRCSLLEGANHCSVYDARPAHCRSFPYWPSVLADADGFERARAVCPGIRIEDEAARERRAFGELAAIYREVDAAVERSRAVCLARGLCCRFEDAGHLLYATALEVAYAAHVGPDAPPPEAPGRCPYHVAGRCTARAARPLGCRTYFCDKGPEDALAATHEHFLARIREVERRHGIAPSYAPFPAALAARGVGVPEATE
jgi:Fe-S-cluster containining protein